MTECFCFIRMGRYKCNIPEMSTFLRSRVLNQKGPICLFENWADPKEFQYLCFCGKQRKSGNLWMDGNCLGVQETRAGGVKAGLDGAGCSILL